MSVHGNRVFKVIFRVQIYHSFINYPGFITSLGSALGLSSIYLLRIKKMIELAIKIIYIEIQR